MPVEVIGRIVPNLLHGDVVLYASNEASGTQRVALQIVDAKKLPLIGVSISHVTVLRDLQPSKQKSPKLVTEDGMVIDVRKEQPEYLEVIDYQLFAVNTVEKWIGYYLWV